MPIQISRDPLIIQTRARHPIDNALGLKMLAHEIEQRNRVQQGKHPAGAKLMVRKGPTGVYNCHGLTFLSRRAWLGEENEQQTVEMILHDDDYDEIEARQALPGDVILYYYDDGALEHSGIVINNPPTANEPEPWILSKWGHGGEFIHRYNYCPYHWRNVRFWREGKND